MATWIVHLRVAEGLLDVIDKLDQYQLLLGSLAPDSGLPNEKRESYDPPWEVTHFGRKTQPKWPIKDLEFYRRYLGTSGDSRRNNKRYSFLVGYFFHLVTDNLWHYDVDLPARSKYSEEFNKDPRFIWEVIRDRFGLDFLYLKEHPESLFWDFLDRSERVEEYLDFLPAKAIESRMEYIRGFYQSKENLKNRTNKPSVYLSAGRVEAFVERSTRQIRNIYSYLNAHEHDVSRCSSAFELQLGSAGSEETEQPISP